MGWWWTTHISPGSKSVCLDGYLGDYLAYSSSTSLPLRHRGASYLDMMRRDQPPRCDVYVCGFRDFAMTMANFAMTMANFAMSMANTQFQAGPGELVMAEEFCLTCNQPDDGDRSRQGHATLDCISALVARVSAESPSSRRRRRGTVYGRVAKGCLGCGQSGRSLASPQGPSSQKQNERD